MKLASTLSSFWNKHGIHSQNDYQKGDPGGPLDNKKPLMVGGAVGAVAGAAWGGYSALVDEVVERPVQVTLPKADFGPDPVTFFGSEYDQLSRSVSQLSDGSGSAAQSLRYLAHLKSVSPQTPTAILESIHGTLDDHFPRDADTRNALNTLASYAEKNPGARLYPGVSQMLDDGVERFQSRHGLTNADLEATREKIVSEHTTLLGRFGTVGAIAVGAGVGLAGGVAVGVAYNLITRPSEQ